MGDLDYLRKQMFAGASLCFYRPIPPKTNFRPICGLSSLQRSSCAKSSSNDFNSHNDHVTKFTFIAGKGT